MYSASVIKKHRLACLCAVREIQDSQNLPSYAGLAAGREAAMTNEFVSLANITAFIFALIAIGP
jgi:hypothetical protein